MDLDWGDVCRLGAFLALGHLVGDFVTLIEGLKPTTCYPAVVYEDVLAPIIGLDEAVALVVSQ